MTLPIAENVFLVELMQQEITLKVLHVAVDDLTLGSELPSIEVFVARCFSLSLSGHRQPVLCLENSSSSRLLISGWSDRKIKIWNRDFGGGCHRSFFADDHTITAIQFENEMETDQYLLPGQTKKEEALAPLKTIESFPGVTNIVLVIRSPEREISSSEEDGIVKVLDICRQEKVKSDGREATQKTLGKEVRATSDVIQR